MSLASYIGTNVKIPLNDEGDESLIIIEDCFSDESEKQEVQENQFTTPFIYEVSSQWGIEITEYMNEKMRAESKAKLILLCEILDNYIEKGDFFELYSCWMGDEGDKREGDITLEMNDFDVERIQFPEKTLIRFEKSQ